MAADEKTLEELYELLDLYFGIEIGNGCITPGKRSGIEPQLDRQIARELILAKITTLIMTEFHIR